MQEEFLEKIFLYWTIALLGKDLQNESPIFCHVFSSEGTNLFLELSFRLESFAYLMRYGCMMSQHT